MPGKYITSRKVAMTYNWDNRPDNETIGEMMQELSSSYLGLYVVKLGFVKYEQPDIEDLLIYDINPRLYQERYNTPVLPSNSMNAIAIQKLDSVAISMPSKPPEKVHVDG